MTLSPYVTWAAVTTAALLVTVVLISSHRADQRNQRTIRKWKGRNRK